MTEATNGIVQRDIKGANKDCFIFDSWFSSKKLSEAVMDVVTEMIGIVKTNKKVFCKDTINNITKYWPGGSYLVLRSKPMLPRGRPLIAIVYKYNTRTVLSFIVTENSDSTNSDIPYLSKYPDQFSNVSIHPVASPIVTYKFFGSVNEVNSHKKPRKSDFGSG